MYKIIKVTTMVTHWHEDEQGRTMDGYDYAGHRIVVVTENRLDDFYESLVDEFDCDSHPETEVVAEFDEFELKQIVNQADTMLKEAEKELTVKINKCIAELLS
jgi:hypothetical protein